MSISTKLTNSSAPKNLNLSKSLFLLLFCLISFNVHANSIHSAANPILVDSQWVQNNFIKKDKQIVILDLRSREAYLKGHIPSSINIPFTNFNRSINKVKGFLIAPLSFQDLMEKNGIKPTDHLVLYSDKTVLDATRVYWSFDFYGHQKLSVLKGGLAAWKRDIGTTEVRLNTLKPSKYVVSIHPEKFASKFKTAMATQQSNTYLIDARPSEEYNGLKSKTDVFGRIPSSQNLPWKQLVKSSETPAKEDSYFQYLSIGELDEQFKDAPLDANIIVYCNGGKESSVVYFGLKLLGREAALYDGSWFEWSSDKSLPITPPNKAVTHEQNK
ncbi:sulfurtransferase [Thiomicrorhabdus lithotrophica]|uniref:Sulfurtransferase n=1 Tax=Thiomicrorhabdus lithotrophica TaxID=2949997 RepID=A0ABY8C806_9GAMM|nr:rhodanese-like domain-containing protein [Thiomicrorhabdus lithotrophica]WEJ62096.1 rhodanese-like domain-containing protein [Thiomicrorhabdus lithotrophica]